MTDSRSFLGKSKLAAAGTRKTPTRRHLWLERLLALAALINLCLVFFDISYITLRDFYLQQVPSLTRLYDPIKGIEPNRETLRYLTVVHQLQEQVSSTGLDSPQVGSSLETLRNLSNEIIQDNPFAGANKSGTLEKIKNLMRVHVGVGSARQAFTTFWSREHILQKGWEQEINFFNTQIQPLIQTNYYRDLGENGKSVDNFWLLDSPFVILFGLDFLIRTLSISRHHPQLNWLEAMLRRWYDIFLLLPFWRPLRVIPVTIRLYQAQLLDLQPVRTQVNRDFVANFAEELTEIVGIRIINQLQELIKQGNIARWLLQADSRRPYIDINQTNELQAIASHLLELSVTKVLPQIQADIEALVHHSVESILAQSPAYQQLANVPGVSQINAQLSERLAKDISQATYKTMNNLITDPVVVERSNRIVQNFSKALATEMQKTQNIQAIQSLIIDLLEEIKINYVKGIAEEGVEKYLEQTEQIRYSIHPRKG